MTDFDLDNTIGHLICNHFSKWFEKSGWPENKVVLYYKPPIFLVWEKCLTRKKIRVWRTFFLEPLFYTFLEKRLQNKWSNGLNGRCELLLRRGVGNDYAQKKQFVKMTQISEATNFWGHNFLSSKQHIKSQKLQGQIFGTIF